MLAILKNPAYTGKTYAYTTEKGRVHQRPKEEWIEIPDVTPPIISIELFEAAQSQLRVNSEKATRNNTKHQYLLEKHLRCKQCGHTYTGDTDIKKRKKGIVHRRLYRCQGKKRDNSPVGLCKNKGWGADKLETQGQTSHNAVINVPELDNFIGHIQQHLSNLDFDEKCQSFEMLGITVWLDGEVVEINGTIDPEMAGIATTSPL